MTTFGPDLGLCGPDSYLSYKKPPKPAPYTIRIFSGPPRAVLKKSSLTQHHTRSDLWLVSWTPVLEWKLKDLEAATRGAYETGLVDTVKLLEAFDFLRTINYEQGERADFIIAAVSYYEALKMAETLPD